MVPFHGSGFTASGIYVTFDIDQGTCRNCKGTGIDQEVLRKAKLINPFIEVRTPCWYCNGAGKVTVGGLPPVLGRVLKTFACREVREGDVVRFQYYTYNDVDLTDGRSFAVMSEKVAFAIIDGWDETPVNVGAA